MEENTETSGYKYEVAFSFRSQDELIATKLNDSVSGGLKTFIYTERQKEIAGTNGMDTFSKVFSKEARLVVLLYRDGWGKTNWTRVEENAITGRILEKGWDFLLFVKLDDESTLPVWMTKTHMRIDFKNSSMEALKGIIEYKVAELGGKVSLETLEDYAAKFRRELENTDAFLRININSSQQFTERPFLLEVEEKYIFNMNEIREIGWIDSNMNFWTSNELIDYWIKTFLDTIIDKK